MLLLLLVKPLAVSNTIYSNAIKGLVTIQCCAQPAFKLTVMHVLRDDNYTGYTTSQNPAKQYTIYPAYKPFFPQLNRVNKYSIRFARGSRCVGGKAGGNNVERA